MNYRLELMYDGTHYAGWQKQNNAPTIQGELERALSVIVREAVSVTGVSRTDAGVHAQNFTANVNLPEDVMPYQLIRGVNALLPDDIRLMDAFPCHPNFNARFDAVKKTYIYRIDLSHYANVFYKNISWHHPAPLDVKKMKEAAAHFLGEHDFYGFMSQGGSSKTFTRMIYESSIDVKDNFLEYKITGNGFLYNMVRIITGTLVAVGKGKIKPEEIPEIIASRDRTRAGMTAPAKGLTLFRAYYEENTKE